MKPLLEWWRRCRHRTIVRERSAMIREGDNMFSRSERECACGIVIIETRQESKTTCKPTDKNTCS